MKSDKRKKIEVKTRVTPVIADFLDKKAKEKEMTVYTLLQKLLTNFYRKG